MYWLRLILSELAVIGFICACAGRHLFSQDAIPTAVLFTAFTQFQLDKFQRWSALIEVGFVFIISIGLFGLLLGDAITPKFTLSQLAGSEILGVGLACLIIELTGGLKAAKEEPDPNENVTGGGA